jgi:hypothetical protein
MTTLSSLGVTGTQSLEVKLTTVIEKPHLEPILTRLKSLAAPSSPQCKYHELAYRYNTANKTETIEVRVRCDLTANPPRWTLHEFGTQARRDTRGVVARSVIDVNVGSNIGEFLTAMGFK